MNPARFEHECHVADRRLVSKAQFGLP